MGAAYVANCAYFAEDGRFLRYVPDGANIPAFKVVGGISIGYASTGLAFASEWAQASATPGVEAPRRLHLSDAE